MSSSSDVSVSAGTVQNTADERIAIADITRDPELNCRASGVVASVARDYAAVMKEHGADRFPPIVVYIDSKGAAWVADGFHRCAAAELAGINELRCERRQGTRRDALLFAAGANAEHGRARTPADKRASVARLLADPTWAKRSDNWIAGAAKVSHTFVAKVRSTCNDTSGGERETSDGRTMDTSRIGKSEAKVAEKLLARIEDLITQWPDSEHPALVKLLAGWVEALTPAAEAAE